MSTLLITITDNNTNKSYCRKTTHGALKNDLYHHLAPKLQEEMLKNDKEHFIMDDQNLIAYYKDRYDISFMETPIDGRGRYARQLDYFNWYWPLEYAISKN